MKPLERKIGYVKPKLTRISTFPKKEVVKETPTVVNDMVESYTTDTVTISEDVNSKKIVKWINTHPKFKWGAMCKDLNMDRANFQKTLKATEPKIPVETILKIEQILIPYGYM